MRLLVTGSVALDTLEGPFGRVSGELGGSALYFALAASLIRPVEIVAPVGRDAEEPVRRLLAERPVGIDGLSVLDLPTYRWSARQHLGSNLDRGGSDSIYDGWDPEPPAGYDGWAFIGSMRPDKQARAANALRDGARLLAGDSMRSYVSSRPREAEQFLGACGWFFANEEELLALGGIPGEPLEFLSRWGLDGLVVKAGAAGSTIWTSTGSHHQGALGSRPVIDVTGAGDALAGGMLARWLEIGGGPADLGEALAHGVACASLAISEVGLRGLARATPADLEERVSELLG